MIPRIRYIAVYQVAAVSAITHLAEVARIEPWKDSPKYAVYFKAATEQIGPVKWVPNGRVMAPQSSRYTSLARLESANTLDDVF